MRSNKEQFPPTPQFLPCLWPKFASSRNRWMGRAECRAVPNTHPPMMIFFSPKIGAVAGSRVGATRDGRASDMQLLELLTPLVTTTTPTREELARAASNSRAPPPTAAACNCTQTTLVLKSRTVETRWTRKRKLMLGSHAGKLLACLDFFSLFRTLLPLSNKFGGMRIENETWLEKKLRRKRHTDIYGDVIWSSSGASEFFNFRNFLLLIARIFLYVSRWLLPMLTGHLFE